MDVTASVIDGWELCLAGGCGGCVASVGVVGNGVEEGGCGVVSQDRVGSGSPEEDGGFGVAILEASRAGAGWRFFGV